MFTQWIDVSPDNINSLHDMEFGVIAVESNNSDSKHAQMGHRYYCSLEVLESVLDFNI